jgi:hypothetical protein
LAQHSIPPMFDESINESSKESINQSVN